jgi:SAM-dependent methyltransferase
MTDDGDPNVWTAYWKTGALSSCCAGAFEVRFAEIWGALTDQLGGNSRVLDLATGNGVAARACAARARQRGMTLHVMGVDAAAIKPEAVSDPAGVGAQITFKGGVALERLPCPDASFDAVISQFGFEYADEPRAAAEAARVLAPGGRLRFIVHARDGAVHADISGRVLRLRAALADDGPAGLARVLARAVSAGDAAALARASARLPQAMADLRALAVQAPPDDAAVFYSRAFLQDWHQRERYRPDDLRRAIEAGWETANGVAARQEQMLRVARTAEDIEALATRFASLGLVACAVEPIRDEARGAQIAWLIDAARP